ncbi:MAG: hypothetical protein V7643_3300 [Mycobacterium sp.]|jgi:hypothetical protein
MAGPIITPAAPTSPQDFATTPATPPARGQTQRPGDGVTGDLVVEQDRVIHAPPMGLFSVYADQVG